MQALAMQTQLVELEKKLSQIIGVFFGPDSYQYVLSDISAYREQVYAAVGEEVDLNPLSINAIEGTTDEQLAALSELQGVINAIESMVPGNVSNGYASPNSGYPNALRLARIDLISSLYTAYQSEYDYINGL